LVTNGLEKLNALWVESNLIQNVNEYSLLSKVKLLPVVILSLVPSNEKCFGVVLLYVAPLTVEL